MSKGGTGRGRGWLNLKQNTPAVGGTMPPVSSPTTVPVADPLREDTQFVDIENSDLVNKVKQLNVNDDGILFNQKIKYIFESWSENCQTKEEVGLSFDTLYQASLNDEELATKLVVMISSQTFAKLEVREESIRRLFLQRLQNDFDSSRSLRRTNHVAFLNSVRLLGGFYNRGRLANGLRLTFMATPLMSYLEMLLEEAHINDLQLFTSQIYSNGSAIKSELPEKFVELLNSVRLVLASDRNISKEGKLWLLLALEIVNNRFGILPPEVNKFYEDQLGDSTLASIQVEVTAPIVQTVQENQTLDNYQSKVNVLQVSNSSQDPVSPVYPTSEPNSMSQLMSNSSGFVSDTSSQNVNVNRKENNNSSKHGRPILGAGARLNKYKINDNLKNTNTTAITNTNTNTNSNSNWRDKDNSAGWNNKPKTGAWSANKKNNQKPNKGWEQDQQNTSWEQDKHNKSWEQDKQNKSWEQDKQNKGWEQDKPNKSWDQDKQNKGWEQDKQNKSWEQDKQNKSWEQDKQNKSWEQDIQTKSWEQNKHNKGWEHDDRFDTNYS